MSSHQGTAFNDYFLGFCKDFHSTFSPISHILDLKSKQAIDRTKGARSHENDMRQHSLCYWWVGGVMVYRQKLRSPFEIIITLLESTSLEILNISY